MTQKYRIVSPDEQKSERRPQDEFAIDVLMGLSETPRRLPSKYFYDDRGSDLFRQIMRLKEYYPTESEREILEIHGERILSGVAHRPLNLIDLGAGDADKTIALIRRLQHSGADIKYVPIDISEEAMRVATENVAKAVPNVAIEGLVCEYEVGLRYLSRSDDRSNLVLFLGSNLGNLNKSQSRAFLRRIWQGLKPDDHVLIGFDLKKDIETLLSAYNDSEGVTAAFNLNLLTRINRELGADFELDEFRHFATYDVMTGAMKSYLVSNRNQSVFIEALQHRFLFGAWESIHTEYSYKYLQEDIQSLASDTGFSIQEQFFDSRRYFVDSLWRVDPTNTVLAAPSAV